MPERPLVLFAQPATADKEKSTVVRLNFIDLHLNDKKLESPPNLPFYNELLKMVMLE